MVGGLLSLYLGERYVSKLMIHVILNHNNSGIYPNNVNLNDGRLHLASLEHPLCFLGCRHCSTTWHFTGWF